MPVVRINTHCAASAEKKAVFLRLISATTASMLGKPESYVMVIFNEQPQMLFAGSPEPLAYVELKSLDLPKDRTTEYSSRLCALIGEQLDIPPERIYIEFSAPERHMWGWSGRTF